MSTIKITRLTLYAGSQSGLEDRTAHMEVEIPGNLPEQWQTLPPSSIHYAMQALCPNSGWLLEQQPAWQIPLMLPKTQDFAESMVALVVLLLRELREPVTGGKVLDSCSTPDGSHIKLRVALPWWRKNTLREGVQWVLKLMLQLCDGRTQPDTGPHNARYMQWLTHYRNQGLAPNTLAFADAARVRQIPITTRDRELLLGWGHLQHRFESSFSSRTSALGARNARDKLTTYRILERALLPFPPTLTVNSRATLTEQANHLGWPVVLKPATTEQGIGVMPNIQDAHTLTQAFDTVCTITDARLILQKHIAGQDYRLLVVHGTLVAATERRPAQVRGDGHRNIQQLIGQANRDLRRGTNSRSLMKRLQLDDEALSCLAQQGWQRTSIPPAGTAVLLRRTANISTGGDAVDVTGIIHPANRELAIRAARILGLDIAGIDFITTDITAPWIDTGGVICEVNAQPGFRPHWLATPEQDINGRVLDLIIGQSNCRIPTAAITGTNGKSTTANLLHRIWTESGRTAGVCTTQHVKIGNTLISRQNLSGYPGARLILEDPASEAAIIELPRKGLIRFGHPCDRYDVAALLNVQDDHLGEFGIDSLEQMARLKGSVLERVHGAAVINADDPHALTQRSRIQEPVRLWLFSCNPNSNAALQAHIAAGGDAVYVDETPAGRQLVIAQGGSMTTLMPVADIACTQHGLIGCNVANALAATAIAVAQGIDHHSIRKGLALFGQDPTENPSRFQRMPGFPFELLLDYGHNPAGILTLCDYAREQLLVSGRKRLICCTLGSRHRRHIEQCLPALRETFDDIYFAGDHVRILKSPDWKQHQQPVQHYMDTLEALLQEHDFNMNNTRLFQSPALATEYALKESQPGDRVVILAEPADCLPVIDYFKHDKLPSG